LDFSIQESKTLYANYLYLNNLHHFVERFKEFDNDSLQDFIDYYGFMKGNGITKEEIVEAIKISNDYPKIKEEYYSISDELKEIKRQRDFYLSDNKILMSKNFEMNNECNLILSKIGSQNKLLQLTENELNKKRELLDILTNSGEYAILKNRIEEQVNEFLIQKKEFFKLIAMTILNIIKEDPKKETLVNNILYYNENPDSQFYLVSYEEKIAETAANTLADVALEINTNSILN
jgi:hypothetical protein